MKALFQNSNTEALLHGSFRITQKRIFIRLRNRVCDNSDELFTSQLCYEVVRHCVEDLVRRRSILLGIFGGQEPEAPQLELLIKTFLFLSKAPADMLPGLVKGSDVLLKDRHLLNDFVEHLYNYWRNYDRFIICDSEGDAFDKRPFRTFNQTVENLTHLVRKTYRDVQENIMSTHPRIYRQVSAGAQMATIALPKDIPYPDEYQKLNKVPVVRQILIYPPLVFDPPMNKRKGQFKQITENPLKSAEFKPDEWLCYPAKVGSLVILIYFHERFFELGLSLCNLFELASDEDLERKPDAVYAFGVPAEQMTKYGAIPTVFFDDQENDLLVGAVPAADEFAYFGYAKKMILTLHNIRKMKAGHMPFHGALVRVLLKGNKSSTLLLMGDSGAGKSETLEAFREIGEEFIQDLVVIADDMGSLTMDEKDDIIGYGTEIGAFLRLDDLQPGYALGQIDRAIIMSANQVNARIILPVTTFENVIKGHRIDFVLYANNYEPVDTQHPILQRFQTPQDAIAVFRDGNVMSKGTTNTTGLVQTYFANVFGPAQYKDLHEGVAGKFFDAFFKKGLFVGQMRTRLGLSGWERKGPEEAARELLKTISA